MKVERILPRGRGYDAVRAALRTQKPLFASAFGFSAAINVLALTTSIYMLQVYDRVLSSRSVDTLLLLTIIATAGILVFSGLESLRLRLLVRIGMRVGEQLSPKVLRAMVAATSQNSGAALHTGVRDTETVRNFVGSNGFAAMLDAPFILVYLLVLLVLSPVFVLIVLAGGGVLVLLAIANQRTTNPDLVRSMTLAARANEFAEDGLRNSDVLEGMGMSSAFVCRWRNQWLESLAIGTEATDRDSKLQAWSRSVRLLIYIFLLGAGALLILHFKGTGGIMIAASIIGGRALSPIESFIASWKSIIAVRMAWERLNVLLEHAPRRDEGMSLPAPTGQVQFRSVFYAVPSTRKAVLQNISFELAAGESLGIVGASAAGKSTLLRLMVGAWPASSGGVRLDGADIYSWPRAELSRHIGYLPQDVELFSGTIRENIARMSEGDPQGVVRAAKRAGAHEMILSLPKGYDTDIGTYGHKLSGGQSQRIGIARALYGEPRLVVLDEPNSNLDSFGEESLLQTIAQLNAERVTLAVVAHRSLILQNVDKMLVLRPNGTIEAFGPRDKVVQRFARGPGRPLSNVVPLNQDGVS
ncbi:MAG: type I secretion system permease/ATPase [Rhizomicrobium sp.]